MIAYPDVTKALFSRLTASATLVSDTNNRISDEVKDAWGFSARLAKPAITVVGPAGGPGVVNYPLCAYRYDFNCYGATRRHSNELMAKLLGYLVPQDPTTVGGTGFTANGIRVTSIEMESGPTALVDPDNGWVYTWVPLIVRFIGVPAS